MIPLNALLLDNSTLRVTVGNIGKSAYSGPLVVSVSFKDAPVSEKVFSAEIAASGQSSFELPLVVVISGQKDATLTLSIPPEFKEARTDNNVLTIGITPPKPTAIVSLIAQLQGDTITVVVSSSGAAYSPSGAKIVVTIDSGDGKSTTEKPVSLSIPKDGSVTVTGIAKPAGSGTATVELVVGGQTVASQSIPVP